MVQDQGLTAHPWLTVVLGPDGIVVDGAVVQQVGGADEIDLDAVLQRAAVDVARPLGRAVGATVLGVDGARRHVALRPDGRVDDLALLVAAAAAPLVPVADRAPTTRAPGTPPTPARRWWLVAAAALLLVASIVGGAGLLRDRDDSTDGAGGPTGADESGRAAAANPGAQRRPDVEVSRAGRARVRVVVTGLGGAPRVRIVLTSPDGNRVRRVLDVEGNDARIVIGDLPAGRTSWRVSARGFDPVAGTVRVSALLPPQPS